MTSRNAYVTSKELSDHSKTDHGGDLGGSKPFRCGLTGCEKSWKVRSASLGPRRRAILLSDVAP